MPHPSVEHTKGLQMDAFQSVLRMKRHEESIHSDRPSTTSEMSLEPLRLIELIELIELIKLIKLIELIT